jgi:hypothetical protein
VVLVGEQIGLDGAMRLHRGALQRSSGRRNFTKDGCGEVFRGALRYSED